MQTKQNTSPLKQSYFSCITDNKRLKLARIDCLKYTSIQRGIERGINRGG
jgi:hypothetical protein